MSITSYLVVMLLWLIFEAALALVAAADHEHHHPAAQITLAVVRVILVALTSMQLGRT